MIEFFVLAALAAAGILLLAIAYNFYRAARTPKFDLTPNCLLTRKPLLFLTGPRSIFYFKNYWNLYPAYLAEHGYEVYTLHLPWRSRLLRTEALQKALLATQTSGTAYHFILDTWSLLELEELHSQLPAVIQSTTVIGGQETLDVPRPVLHLLETPNGGLSVNELIYRCHATWFPKAAFPSLAVLGGTKALCLQNARLVLERARSLAESDFLENT